MATGKILPAAQAFGIGTPKLLSSADTLSAVSAPGLYAWGNADVSPADIPFTGGRMIVVGRGDSDFSQIVIKPDSGSLLIRRIYTSGGGVLGWRWIDPPMEAGTEYLLAEQYRGKDVYCKCMIFGANNDGSIAANTTSTKEFVTGLTNPGHIVRGYAYGDLNDSNHIHLPFKDSSNHEVNVRMYYYKGGGTWRARLAIDTNSELTNVYGCLWYTKD